MVTSLRTLRTFVKMDRRGVIEPVKESAWMNKAWVIRGRLTTSSAASMGSIENMVEWKHQLTMKDVKKKYSVDIPISKAFFAILSPSKPLETTSKRSVVRLILL